jgi:hypothetical protein
MGAPPERRVARVEVGDDAGLGVERIDDFTFGMVGPPVARLGIPPLSSMQSTLIDALRGEPVQISLTEYAYIFTAMIYLLGS